jgi:hypothetical protein
MNKKPCSKCSQEKDIDEFPKYARSQYCGDGHRAKCKTCMYADTKEDRKRYASRPEIRKQINLRANKSNRKSRIDCINHYGRVCACCKESRIEFLVIDHINGGGNKEREKTKGSGGWKFAVWLRQHDYPKGYRVLCHNCNSALGFYGYCPHNMEDLSNLEGTGFDVLSVEPPSLR